MKIIAMLPVKNEAWVLEHCLSSLSFCDEIIAIDDGSTDTTRLILQQHNCTIIEMETKAEVGWKEFEIRSRLLRAAREHGATHLVATDADEVFSDSFVLQAREILSKLSPGESLALPWLNVSSPETIMTPTLSKVFIMADNKTAKFNEGFLHIPRVPAETTNVTLEEPHAVIHFQYLNAPRNYYKRTWYMMSELLHKDRSAYRINATYSITKELSEVAFSVNKIYSSPLPDPSSDIGLWQKTKVEELLNQYGYKYFEALDIWDNAEMQQHFIANVGKKPKPQIPSSLVLKLNTLKNKIKGRILN